MADILACTKMCSNLKIKQNVHVCCICIYQYLLKYVLLIILLTIKGFMNKISLLVFEKLVAVVGVGSSFCSLTPESV